MQTVRSIASSKTVSVFTRSSTTTIQTYQDNFSRKKERIRLTVAMSILKVTFICIRLSGWLNSFLKHF